MASTPSAHVKAPKHDISYARIQPIQPPTRSMLPSSLSLRLSGSVSWCNESFPSASLIPYIWPTHSLALTMACWFHPALLRHTPLLSSSYRIGHPIAPGSACMDRLRCSILLRPDGIYLSQNVFFSPHGPARGDPPRALRLLIYSCGLVLGWLVSP